MPQVLQKFSDNCVAKVCRLDGFNLSDVTYRAALKQPRHTHKHASFSYVLAGTYLENYGRRDFVRQQSTVIFHPPEEAHAVDFQTDVRIFNVEFDFQRLAQIRRNSVVLDESASYRSETIAWLGTRIHREFQRMDAFSMLSIEGLTLEILAEAARCKINRREKSFPRWLGQINDFLHHNFAESITLEEIAAVADVHPVHLSRVFREKYGCTIGEYVRRLRVEFASRQISSTDAPLSEIALAAGFSDQSHLNKTFKTVFGLTPAEHRKISRRHAAKLD